MHNTYTVSLDSLKKSLKKTEDRLPMIVETPQSFTRFKVTGTGQYFYYSNYTNGLYNSSMEPLSEVTTPTKLNREQEELIKKFASLRGEDGNSATVKADDGSIMNKLRGAFRF